MSVATNTVITVVSGPVSVNGFPGGSFTVSDVKDYQWPKMDTATVTASGTDLNVFPAGFTKINQVYVKVASRCVVKLTPVGGSEIAIPVYDVLCFRDMTIGFSAMKINGSGDAEIVVFGE